jgi:hypothetical protein
LHCAITCFRNLLKALSSIISKRTYIFQELLWFLKWILSKLFHFHLNNNNNNKTTWQLQTRFDWVCTWRIRKLCNIPHAPITGLRGIQFSTLAVLEFIISKAQKNVNTKSYMSVCFLYKALISSFYIHFPNLTKWTFHVRARARTHTHAHTLTHRWIDICHRIADAAVA